MAGTGTLYRQKLEVSDIHVQYRQSRCESGFASLQSRQKYTAFSDHLKQAYPASSFVNSGNMQYPMRLHNLPFALHISIGIPKVKQEVQLMLINPRDAFRGQSRSSNIVPFHTLGIVSSCAIVTLSLRRDVFQIFDFKKCRDLEFRIRGHSMSLKVLPFDRLRMISYQCSTETLSLKCTVFEIFNFKNAVTLKIRLGVRQGH